MRHAFNRADGNDRTGISQVIEFLALSMGNISFTTSHEHVVVSAFPVPVGASFLQCGNPSALWKSSPWRRLGAARRGHVIVATVFFSGAGEGWATSTPGFWRICSDSVSHALTIFCQVRRQVRA
jgi:hypothetical protein